jgi:hypothetical protein
MPARRPLAAAALSLAAVALPLLAAPAAAPAEVYHETEYSARVQVTATWKYHRQEDFGDRETDEVTANATVTSSATLEHLLFRNGELITPPRIGTASVTATGGVTHRHTYPKRDGTNAMETKVTNCGVSPIAALPAELRAAQGPAGHASFVVRPMEGVGLSYPGCSPRPGNGVAFDVAFKPWATGVYDTMLQLPHEVIGMGKIIEMTEALPIQRSPFFCPGKDAFTDDCEFTWTGRVTLTRTGGDLYDPAKPPPPVDPRAEAISRAVEQYGQELPPVPVDPRAEAISKAVEQYGREIADPRARIISDAVRQYGDQLRFEANCPSGCEGAAVITPGGGARARTRAHGSAARALATLRFKVRPGRRQVRLTLPRAARKALRRSRTARVRLTLAPKGGAPFRTTLKLRRVR